MSGADEHDDTRLLLGAYVLGGLDAADRARVDRHLSVCPECRREVMSFAGLPGLLRTVDAVPGEEPLKPPTSMLPGLLAQVRSERREQHRQTRNRWLASAAAVLLVISGSVGFALSRGGDTDSADAADSARPAQTVSLIAESGRKASGEVDLVHRGWGTEVTIRVEGLPDSGPYTLVVGDAAGRTQNVCTWGATPAGKMQVTGASSFTIDQVRDLRVTDADGSVLWGRAG